MYIYKYIYIKLYIISLKLLACIGHRVYLFYLILITNFVILSNVLWKAIKLNLSWLRFGFSDLFNFQLLDILIRVPTFPHFPNNIVDGQLSTHAGPYMFYHGRDIPIIRPRFINNIYLGPSQLQLFVSHWGAYPNSPPSVPQRTGGR